MIKLKLFFVKINSARPSHHSKEDLTNTVEQSIQCSI